MGTIVNCDCGYTVRGETEDEVIEKVQEHIAESHPEMAEVVTREDILSMAEEEPTGA